MNHSLTAARVAIITACLLFCVDAIAGSVSGPFLIWMNLANDTAADEALHEFTHAEITADSCWNSSALLVYRDFPSAITPALVQRAVLKREPAAQARLRALMHKGDADLERYDGIVVIPQTGKPTIVSFAASGKIKSRPAIDKAGNAHWADAFCDVLPPISRKP